jgi:nitroreductase
MNLEDAIRRRRMIRSYSTETVSLELVSQLLVLSLYAPSGGFTQATQYLVVSSPYDREMFWQQCASEEFRNTAQERWPTWQEAPVIVIPLSSQQAYLDRYSREDKRSSGLDVAQNWPAPYWDMDTAMAVQNLLLLVTSNRLAACYFGLFGEQIRTFLNERNVPDSYSPIGAVTIGVRPAELEAGPPVRLRIDSLVRIHHDRFPPN